MISLRLISISLLCILFGIAIGFILSKKPDRKKTFSFGALGFLVGLVIGLSRSPVLAAAIAGSLSLASTIAPRLSDFNLPAIAAAVVKNGEIISSGAVGVCKFGSNIPVTINDPFHIGSDIKAMTALFAAIMVEEGKMRWHSAIAEIFPEIADKMDSTGRNVTLEQLLSHTSGMPSDNENFGNILESHIIICHSRIYCPAILG